VRSSAPVHFDVGQLATSIKAACPRVVFALLMGSSKAGTVAPESDVDVAVYVEDSSVLDTLLCVSTAAEAVAGGAPVDVGVLNGAEPVYRFEALGGSLLFTRDTETWLRFFSLTCREYEHWMGHYAKQRRYRRELAAPTS
jgi:predicted nucleotidyltransferase